MHSLNFSLLFGNFVLQSQTCQFSRVRAAILVCLALAHAATVKPFPGGPFPPCCAFLSLLGIHI